MNLLKLILLLMLIVGLVSSRKIRKHKDKKRPAKVLNAENPSSNELLSSEGNPKKLASELFIDKTAKEVAVDEDPCLKHKCGPGKECEISEEGKAHCVCVKKCPDAENFKRKVCSNHNETWESDCELYQMRCYCTEGMDGCKLDKYAHLHIDYYGNCKEIGQCKPEELEDFPRRMRDWLFNVMQELARREQLQGTALKMEQEAEKTLDRKWVNAVIWKFCDLDVHPHDRYVSRHELFPLRAPLMAMEHCVAPFLDGCDANDDHKITLREWGDCLGLEEDEIEDKCQSTVHSG